MLIRISFFPSGSQHSTDAGATTIKETKPETAEKEQSTGQSDTKEEE